MVIGFAYESSNNEVDSSKLPTTDEATYFPFSELPVNVNTNVTFSFHLSSHRPAMRTPTNVYLAAVSISDALMMATYVVYTLHVNVMNSPDPCQLLPRSKAWVYFILFHTWAAISTHSASTLIIICLAGMRCLSVYSPLSGPKHCNMYNVKRSLIFVFVISALTSSPILYSYRLCRMSVLGPWWFEIQNWAISIEATNFIIYGMVVKILASIIICILSTLLIVAMRRASQRRSRLRGARRTSKTAVETGTKGGGSGGDPQSRESNRNTAMLATVAITFVLTEFPQGILSVVAALSECFHLFVYAKIMNFMDTLLILNSSINFILYCSMSQQFRDTFCQLFMCTDENRNARNGYRSAAGKTTAMH